MRIEQLDPRDDDAWESWYATYRTADIFERPCAAPYASVELRSWRLDPTSGERVIAFAGIEESGVVATAQLGLTLKDNLDMATIELHVRPDVRRRGLGSRMLAHVEERAVALDRSLMTVETSYPYDAGEVGFGSAGADFARSHGYTFRLGSVRRHLDLPADPDFLRSLRKEAEPHHRAYRFRQYVGRAPDDLVEEIGQLIGQVGVESPLGDLELEAEVFDTERMREEERHLEAVGRRRYVTAAFDDSGHPVAYSELVVASQDEGKAYQWGTLVLPEHRGHRLGVAVKVRNLEFLQSREPDAPVVITDNAESNEHMVGINVRLGFRPVERSGEFQKRL